MNLFTRRLLLALLFGVLVYALVVAFTGFEQLRGAVRHFQWWTLAAALALSSFNYVLRFFKWEFYLRKLQIPRIPWRDNFLIFLSGFVLTVTPGKLGEVFKSAVLQETHGVDMARTAPIVVAERLTDVIAVIVLIFVGSLGFSGGLVWALLGSTAVLLGLGLILWQAPLLFLLRLLEQRGGALANWAPRLRTALESLRIVASPSSLLVPTLLSLIGWGGEGFALFLLVQGFGEVVSLPLAVFFYATSTLAGALVPTPGGLGVAEAMFQTQLVELGGVAVGAATASMLLIRFATLWWAVLVGFFALFLLRLRFPHLLRGVSSGNSHETSHS